MKITESHPLARDVFVSLDGERLNYCIMADERQGIAEVALLDADGKPQREDGRLLTEIRRGQVSFTAKPGHENDVMWFMTGWICAWEEAGGGAR